MRDGTVPVVQPEDPYAKCPECEGDGWYIGHDDACYESGDCSCSGVQIGCFACQGTGRRDV